MATGTPTKAAPAKPADKPVYKPVTIEYDEDTTKALKSGAPKEPSPLLADVQAALDTGRARGTGYGDEYKKNTVLAHLRKAAEQVTRTAEQKAMVLRTYDRSDYKDAEGKAWPHIGYKWVTKPPAKAKPDATETAPAETTPTA